MYVLIGDQLKNCQWWKLFSTKVLMVNFRFRNLEHGGSVLEEPHAPFLCVQPELPEKQDTPFSSCASAVSCTLCCVMITALVSLDPILILQDYVYVKVPHAVDFHNRGLGCVYLCNTVLTKGIPGTVFWLVPLQCLSVLLNRLFWIPKTWSEVPFKNNWLSN